LFTPRGRYTIPTPLIRIEPFQGLAVIFDAENLANILANEPRSLVNLDTANQLIFKNMWDKSIHAITFSDG
jgi:hypothetical protein